MAFTFYTHTKKKQAYKNELMTVLKKIPPPPEVVVLNFFFKFDDDSYLWKLQDQLLLFLCSSHKIYFVTDNVSHQKPQTVFYIEVCKQKLPINFPGKVEGLKSP